MKRKDLDRPFVMLEVTQGRHLFAQPGKHHRFVTADEVTGREIVRVKREVKPLDADYYNL